MTRKTVYTALFQVIRGRTIIIAVFFDKLITFKIKLTLYEYIKCAELVILHREWDLKKNPISQSNTNLCNFLSQWLRILWLLSASNCHYCPVWTKYFITSALVIIKFDNLTTPK